MKIRIRQVEPSDHAFIYATYIRNKWFDKANKTTLKRSTWSSLQHKRLEELLSVSDFSIACLDDDPEYIIGYGFLDQNEPFVYVKLNWRSEKLAIRNKLEKEVMK